jgi:hypothetical protein
MLRGAAFSQSSLATNALTSPRPQSAQPATRAESAWQCFRGTRARSRQNAAPAGWTRRAMAQPPVESPSLLTAARYSTVYMGRISLAFPLTHSSGDSGHFLGQRPVRRSAGLGGQITSPIVNNSLPTAGRPRCGFRRSIAAVVAHPGALRRDRSRCPGGPDMPAQARQKIEWVRLPAPSARTDDNCRYHRSSQCR